VGFICVFLDVPRPSAPHLSTDWRSGRTICSPNWLSAETRLDCRYGAGLFLSSFAAALALIRVRSRHSKVAGCCRTSVTASGSYACAGGHQALAELVGLMVSICQAPGAGFSTMTAL